MFTQNPNLEAQVIELKRQYSQIMQLLQTSQQQAREFQEQLAEVKIVINSLTDKNAELECLSNPYSQDGTPICNFP